jgi:hypothetical protein
VIGYHYNQDNRANVAFAGMGGVFDFNDSSVSNGASISLSHILADGTIGGFFTEGEYDAWGEKIGIGWTVENGKLPGLFGNTVDIPQYLIDNDVSVLTRDRVIPPIVPSQEAVIIADAGADGNRPVFSAGPNPVAKYIGRVGFYRQGGSVFGELAVYDISGNVIRKISITDKSIGNKNRRLVGEWDLRDAKGYLVSEGTYLVRGVVKTADGKREKVSVSLGVR